MEKIHSIFCISRDWFSQWNCTKTTPYVIFTNIHAITLCYCIKYQIYLHSMGGRQEKLDKGSNRLKFVLFLVKCGSCFRLFLNLQDYPNIRILYNKICYLHSTKVRLPFFLFLKERSYQWILYLPTFYLVLYMRMTISGLSVEHLYGINSCQFYSK